MCRLRERAAKQRCGHRTVPFAAGFDACFRKLDKIHCDHSIQELRWITGRGAGVVFHECHNLVRHVDVRGDAPWRDCATEGAT